MGLRGVFRFPDAEHVAEAAEVHVLAAAREAFQRHGRFLLGLSGGRTPVPTFAELVAESSSAAIDWNRTQIYFADERAVPPDHPDSNYRLAREALIDPLGIPPRNVHRMKGEYPDLDVAVEEYEAHLTEPLDCLLLGIGEDGHVASLFPHHAALNQERRRVAAVLDAPKPPPRRLTLTPRALAEAWDVLVLATGAEKADAVARALEGEGPASDLPARLLRERTWLIDRAASAALTMFPGGRGA